MLRNLSETLTIIPLLLLIGVSPALAMDAQQLVEDGFNYWRGQASVAVVDMTVHRGEIVTLVWPNGSGKSTALRAMRRLLPVSAGSISLSGRDLKHWTTKTLAQAVATA